MPIAGLENLDTRGPSEDGCWMTLRHPGTFEPLPRRLKLAGPDSDLRQRCLAENARRLARATQLSTEERLDPKEVRRVNAEAMAPCVLGWEGFEEEFTEANVVRLFTEYRWAFDQAETFAAARANFLPRIGPSGSEPSSGG